MDSAHAAQWGEGKALWPILFQQLAKDFNRHVQTDLRPEDIPQLARPTTWMKGTNVVFASFPMGTFTIRNGIFMEG